MNRYFDDAMTDPADLSTSGADLTVTSPAAMPAGPKAARTLPMVAHMVARILGAQATYASDVPALVQTVSAAVAQILNPAPLLPPAEASDAPPIPFARRKPRAQRATSGRKPGRPRKTPIAEPIVAAAPPPTPRLVRRAEAIVSAPAPKSAAMAPQPASTLRGVVRWFDPGRQTGGLRLTGVPEDVAIEPATFAAAGVTRLFKGQEIEAQVSREEGRVRVTALRIPGGTAAITTVSGPIAATGGRRPRVVIVEKKRDGLKRVAARTEAEQLLGSSADPKSET